MSSNVAPGFVGPYPLQFAVELKARFIMYITATCSQWIHSADATSRSTLAATRWSMARACLASGCEEGRGDENDFN